MSNASAFSDSSGPVLCGPRNRSRVQASLVIAGIIFTQALVSAQLSYSSGQPVAPAFEGWDRNPDGSFNMIFGYMNKNWEEEIEVPVGPENNIAPGGPDQGQPAHFYPRRNRFVFNPVI